ncbi:MAG: sigma-70 family RNA polymerase sigma factor [Prevotella sp.]|nr:sigma-70 family RNA polymerase sigma factor [Prevotella sp.]MBR1546379.1 sigma-70 family RNA polymerase sigma factor [Prevotella sp.]
MNNQTLITDYYARHRGEIVDFVAIRIQDRDEAQDMVQNLFLRLLSGHRLITEQTMPCLIYTMARHLIADYYRRRHVYEEYEHYIRRHDDSDDTMESVFSARQIMERMEHSLARLSEECREVYRLHIYDGMKVSEISQQLHVPYKKVENQLGIARKTVRRHLRACV